MSEVKLTQERYDELIKADRKLRALENGGVDNWEWYDSAMKEVHKEDAEDDFVEKLVSDILEAASNHIEEPAGRGCGYGIRQEGYTAAEKVLRAAINKGTIVLKVDNE